MPTVQTPSANVFPDLSNLEKTFRDDRSGDRAREILAYLKNVVNSTEAMLNVETGLDRRVIVRLIEGFHAASRIVRHIWEHVHGCALAV